MKRVLISIILTVSVLLSANAQTKHHVVKVSDFNRLTVIDNINVNYCCNPDSAGLVVFNCSQEIADALIFSYSSNGRLSIQMNDDLYENARTAMNDALSLYSSTLEEAENAGDSVLRVSKLPPLKNFKVRLTDNGKVIVRGVRASQLELQILSGKGKIIADGSCDDLSLRLVGTGEIQADKVKATNVSCRIMGTGSMGCDVNGGELKVSGSGTGKVYYKGNPSKVSVRKLGTIKAIPME